MKPNRIHTNSPLYHLVTSVQTLSAQKPDGETGSYKLFADGLAGLVFYEADAGLYFNSEPSGQLILYGQTVKPLEISYKSDFALIVFYFKPYVIKYLFGIDASELTDTCLDFDLVDIKLRRSLLATENTGKRIQLIIDYLAMKELLAKKKLDSRVTYATEKIAMAGGNISLTNLRNEIFITERTFERQFLQHVGVTPAVFSKICRFNKMTTALKNKNFQTLTELAYSGGYSDQSHFIRHFKEFTSVTPKQYLELLKSKQVI